MARPSKILSRRDLDFLLFEWLDVAGLTSRRRFAGHIVVAWLWLGQAIAADHRAGDFYAGKRSAAAYFFCHELPRIAPQLDLLDSLDTSIADLDCAWL